jgi:hypothetical protein
MIPRREAAGGADRGIRRPPTPSLKLVIHRERTAAIGGTPEILMSGTRKRDPRMAIPTRARDALAGAARAMAVTVRKLNRPMASERAIPARGRQAAIGGGRAMIPMSGTGKRIRAMALGLAIPTRARNTAARRGIPMLRA